MSTMRESSVAGSAGCASCGGLPADMHLGTEGPLCGRYFDDRVVANTGLPRLPDPPSPATITNADGSSRTMIYRLSRGPAGISARLVEQNQPPDGGYELPVASYPKDVVIPLVAETGCTS